MKTTSELINTINKLKCEYRNNNIDYSTYKDEVTNIIKSNDQENRNNTAICNLLQVAYKDIKEYR